MPGCLGLEWEVTNPDGFTFSTLFQLLVELPARGMAMEALSVHNKVGGAFLC
ncbi:hypothetical protein DPMN_019564 [Dreissena polymorpha]|uniref:Uncharacterized protein n=1 Tax=Dreissena polymorpha TaxID=45954 RepID=A0A9D4NH93_DREPO|nr:hypothetical protein DPMN_019564 [Dreissena polymorpha]